MTAAGRRSCWARWIVAVVAATTACSTTEEVFVRTASLTFILGDSSLGSQGLFVDFPDDPPTQILELTIEEASVELAGVGTFDFLESSPCRLTQIVAAGFEEDGCLADGFAVDPTDSADVTVRFTLSRVVQRRAGLRDDDDLDEDGASNATDPDWDGDGVDNGAMEPDNCPLVPNGDCADPSNCDQDGDGMLSEDEMLDGDQKDTDGENFGDACFDRNEDGELTSVLNRDGDDLPDFADNCVRKASDDETDDNANGIGDVCEEEIVLDGPFDPVEIVKTGLVLRAGDVNRLFVDFAGALDGCTFEPKGMGGQSGCFVPPDEDSLVVQ